MDRITRFSLRNAAAIVILVILVTFGGVYSTMQLPREAMPDVNIPVITVVTVYPGAGPGDIYNDITEPVEDALRGVEGIEDIFGTSGDSVSVVVTQFSFSQDMEEAKRLVEETIGRVDLPDGAADPTVSRISFGSSPIVKLALSSETTSTEALHRAAKSDIVPALQGLPGVGEARLASESQKAVRIQFDAEKLKDKNLTVDAVVQQLQAANLSFPVGSVQMGEQNKPVRVTGRISSLDDLGDVRIAVFPDQSALLGDAFAQFGEGFGAIGDALGSLGGAVGRLGGAVGRLGTGMGDMGMSLGTQIGLVAAAQDVQGQILDAKVALAEANNVLRDSSATPAEIAQATAAKAQLEGVIPQLEAALAGIEQRLLAAQKAAAAGASAATPPSGRDSLPKNGSSAPSFDLDAEPADPEITLVKLSEVADISYAAGDAEVISRINGEPAVFIDILKTQDGNTVAVSESVRSELDTLIPSIPEIAEVTYVYDQSVGINASVEGMAREGLLGAFFATVVIALFLRNLRASIIAVVSIPLSLLIAMLLLGRADVTLNIMTLGGLTVAVGRVVDDSIVVIENIFRHVQRGDERTPELVRKATGEVASAITSSTLTTVAVFVPLAFVTGVIGKIFMPFALTVGLALLASLLVALTVVPLMAKWTLLGAKVPVHDSKEGRIALQYRRLLKWSLDHKAIVLSSAGVLLLASLALIPIIGTGFVPETKEKYLTVSVEYPQGTVADSIDAKVTEVEAILHAAEDVEIYQTTVGSSEGAFDLMSGGRGSNVGRVFVKLDADADVIENTRSLRAAFDGLEEPGVNILIERLEVSGSSGGLEVYVLGPDIETIREAAATVTDALADNDGLENVKNNLGESQPEISVTVDQEKAAKQGLFAGSIAGTIRSFLAEQDLGTISVDGDRVPLRYELALDPVDRVEDLAKTELRTPLGESIELRSVADVAEVDGPVAIYTREGSEYAAVSGAFTVRDTGAVINEARAEIDDLDLPEGVEISIGGQAEQMSEAFNQLGMAMLIAVGAVYLVMIVAFGEAIAPLAIMFSLPLAIIGGLVGLLITGLPLDMPAMIGALMLIGIVVTNAIVLVDRVQQKRRDGLVIRDALLEAGTTRMRPILMTAISTICALTPLGIGLSEGSLVSQSLAVIVIGGLTTSTLLTLIIVPVAFELMERVKDRVFAARQ
jgi:HAE1 family hydrophobic/amphiphilic exporter-1